MRLIDASKAMESIDEIVCTMSVCVTKEYCYGMRAMKDKALHAIDEQPTVEAVPVVRCKDCKHWIKSSFFKGKQGQTLGQCDCNSLMRDADFFCKSGVEKGKR